jgi:dephospho-CoA kinase
MISLVSLLKEAINKPQAIFLAGPAGSGKTTTVKNLGLDKFTVINIDDTYEELLKKSGLGLNVKDFGPEELSKAAQMMAQAQKITKQKYAELTQSLKDVIVDGTGAAANPLLKKKKELEDLGYETLILMVYVSPITSLERNKNRDRSLPPGIVLKSWRDVNKNIEVFQQAFGDNFILLNNDPENNIGFDIDFIKQNYLDTTKGFGKPKSPEEVAKSQAEKDQTTKDIENLVKNKPKFTTPEQAKDIINKFTNG